MEYRHPLDPVVRFLERRFGWAAFPGPIRILVIFQVAAALLAMGVEGYRELLSLDKARILEGWEVWRLVTFVFLTNVHPVFLVFALFIMWMINDGLEQEWGTFRVNLYLAGTWAGMVTAAWLLPSVIQTQLAGIETMVLYSSLFIAFATLHPKHELMLFFLLPVQVRWLALLNGAVLVKFVVDTFFVPGLPQGLVTLPVVLGMTPYLLVFVPRLVHHLVHRGQATARRARFQARQLPPDEAFHRCAGCGISDQDHPETDFRVGGDGEEYCPACLPGER
jgi:hypothetical protein